jgi:hypothetical protein
MTDARKTSWSATDLLAATFPPPRYAVPGFITEGLNLFVGAPKLGKSRVAMGLVVAVACGGRAFGKIDVEQGEACYLALEDPPRRLQERLRELIKRDAAPAGLRFDTEWPALDQGGADKLDKGLEAHPDTRLVVIDVFERIRGPVSDRGSIYGHDYASMTALKELADRHRIAMLVVHHVRKAASDDFINTVSGTNGLAGAADTVLAMTRARNSSEAKLSITGRDVPEAEHALKYDAAVGGWILLGPASEYDLTDERRRVLDLLRGRGAATPKQISDGLDITHDNAKQIARRMFDAGQIDTDGKGLYFPAVPLSPTSPLSLISDTDLSPVTAHSDNGDRGDTYIEGPEVA